MKYLLHNVLQGMILGLLEVVTPVDGVKPTVQEELCPLSVADDKTTRRQPVLVLRDDEIYSVTLQVAECLDDALWGNDGSVGDHVRLEFGWRKEGSVDGNVHVHDQGSVIEVPHEHGGGVECHGMAHRRHASPGRWRIADRVLGVGREEGEIAWHMSISVQSTCSQWWSIPCFLAYSSLFFLTFAVHAGSILGSTTVTTTTGGPLPILGFGMFTAVQPPTLVPLLLVPPLPPSIQTRTKKPSMPPASNRPALLRSRFLSAGGIAIPLWFLATYGGGREVFRGGMAKCIV
jgi:hypothetical protein